MKKINNMKPTIGLEIHVELNTRSKMFCGCPANHFGIKPNSHTCPICLGLPGSLPVPNEKAINNTLLLGLSLNSKVARTSKFDRKQYFYPDLPKGFQISQYDEPLCIGGYLEIPGKKVRITRVHLEEDTGKLIHKKVNGKDVSLVDFNRSGVPLVEIVTEPDLVSGRQTKLFAQNIQQIIRFIEVSNCDMEKGSMRLEANISWGKHLGYKVEIKNLNSFKFVEKAIEYELSRQKKLLEKGVIPIQETRGWNETRNVTTSQRYKETSSDYRYFPEPDIPPMTFSNKKIRDIKAKIPTLPSVVTNKLVNDYKMRLNYAEILVKDKKNAKLIEKALDSVIKEKVDVNTFAGIIVNKKQQLTKENIKKIIKEIKSKSEKTIDQKKIEKWVNQALKSLPQAVKDYQKGNLNAIGAIIGQVMKLSSGKADPVSTRKLISRKLQGK